MKKFLLLFLTFAVACSQPSPKENDIHIVPVRKKLEIKSEPSELPPPPIQDYYMPSNFIIDSLGAVYFYQLQLPSLICGTGINWNTPPEFIDLKPNNIVQIPISNIDEFITLNILTLDTKNRLVSIASLKDTIKSAGLSKIIKILSNNSNKTLWTFRKATQEERIVLKFKQQNWKYYSNSVDWDSIKTLFLPKLNDIIKFAPPKVE